MVFKVFLISKLSNLHFDILVQDIETLRDRLPNVQQYRIMRNWNHLDFTYGKNARKYLYKDILQSFEHNLD